MSAANQETKVALDKVAILEAQVSHLEVSHAEWIKGADQRVITANEETKNANDIVTILHGQVKDHKSKEEDWKLIDECLHEYIAATQQKPEGFDEMTEKD